MSSLNLNCATQKIDTEPLPLADGDRGAGMGIVALAATPSNFVE
jgi:hypothetical protein